MLGARPLKGLGVGVPTAFHRLLPFSLINTLASIAFFPQAFRLFALLTSLIVCVPFSYDCLSSNGVFIALPICILSHENLPLCRNIFRVPRILHYRWATRVLFKVKIGTQSKHFMSFWP